MLETLRNAAGTWVAKLLLILLVLSFAVWGISGSILGGVGGNAVVTAGGTTVSGLEYRLAYDRQLAVLSQQFGSRLTREQAAGLGIDDQVLSQLVAGAVLDEQARSLELGASDEQIGKVIRQNPLFAGQGGRFDPVQLDYQLRQRGLDRQDYWEIEKQSALRQQIIEAVSDGLKTPDTFLRAVALYRGENRTAEYIAIPASSIEAVGEPADAILSTWFEENKTTYAAPEYRKIAYVKLEPGDIADEAAITDEQVAADYEANKAQFTTPETRTVEQLVFKTKEAAQAALDSTKAGSTFESIVTAEGKTPADTLLGTFSKDKVPDPAVAEAAFSLEAGAISPVVDGAFGPVLVRVTEIKPEVVRSQAEVAPEIRKDLALAEANRVLLDVHDAYEDSRAAGESMREAAAKANLDVVTVNAVSRTAQRPDDSVINDLPESSDLLAQAFETEVNIENPAINIGGSGFVFYEVEGITPARERTLDEVRAKVVADWKTAETTKRLVAKAEELQKRLADGTPLDTLATELGVEKQTKRGLRREADDGDFGKPGVAELFSVPEGGTGLIEAPTGDAQLLYNVTEVFEPAGADADSVPEDARNSFASGLADDLLDQLVARLQSEYEVSINRNAMTQALAF